MSDLVIAACIAAVPPTLVGILNYWVGRSTHNIVNSRNTEIEAKVARLEKIIHDRAVSDARGG